MAYQRFGKPGRFYVLMGESLNVNTGDSSFEIKEDAAGKDNALALLAGLQDLLQGAGVKLTYDKKSNRLVEGGYNDA